jgi:hypothetical protein
MPARPPHNPPPSPPPSRPEDPDGTIGAQLDLLG